MAPARVQDATSSSWWCQRTLDEGLALSCRVGALHLAVRRLAHEWSVAHRYDKDLLQEPTEAGTRVLSSGADGDELRDPDGVERFLVRKTSAECSVMPALADRSVVSRPERPFRLLAGEAATLFVSSPVWVRVAVGPDNRTLTELPSIVPSDTWIGPSTREGELCYASRTHGRLSLEELTLRPQRAVTPVTIENGGHDALRIERLNLPTPYLSIFSGSRGFLWTEAVTLVREEDDERARLRVTPGPSEPARGGKLLVDPRETRAENGLFHAFSSIFQ